ncbi:MAG TPA: HEAT repeat domain-containing protein [Vicinamibacteria bacterium]|nr:HEAT repeat domain-containing protein [Vicinamibacteria bacterium]
MIRLLSLATAGVLLAALSARASLSWIQSAEGNASYQEGRQALDRGDWARAIEAFQRAGEDEALADAALWWRAYAHHRAGEVERALELVSELDRRFPQSRWRDDARALAAEIRGVSARQIDSGDDELKLMALNGLMHMKDDEAIPILEEILTGGQSEKLRERALFVLAQMDSEPAFAVLARTARSTADGELQRKAIRYLGIHESERSLALLEELYGSLESNDARSDVLHAFMIAGEKQRLLKRAQEEPDPELRGRAIHWLGTMDASAELWELYGRESSEDVKKKILQAFLVAGASEHLLAVARDPSQSEELRKTAVSRLGAEGADDALWELFQQESGVEMKKRILHALFVAGNTERLETVANNASETEELRKAAIHDLGVSGGSEARAALLAIYENESSEELKKQVLHSLFLQDAATELVAIARAETSPELKKTAVHWLSLMDAAEARDFLMEVLRR